MCNLGSSDWTAVMRYFCINGRVAKKVRLPGADEGLYNKIRNFSVSIYIYFSLVSEKYNNIIFFFYNRQKIQYIQKKDWWKHASTWDLFGGKSALRSGDAGSRGHI